MNRKVDEIAIEKAEPKPTLEELLAGIRPDNLHGEQDWGSPVGNEIIPLKMLCTMKA